jgi:hypothetical protein
MLVPVKIHANARVFTAKVVIVVEPTETKVICGADASACLASATKIDAWLLSSYE